jgi:hypothetical protein
MKCVMPKFPTTGPSKDLDQLENELNSVIWDYHHYLQAVRWNRLEREVTEREAMEKYNREMDAYMDQRESELIQGAELSRTRSSSRREHALAKEDLLKKYDKFLRSTIDSLEDVLEESPGPDVTQSSLTSSAGSMSLESLQKAFDQMKREAAVPTTVPIDFVRQLLGASVTGGDKVPSPSLDMTQFMSPPNRTQFIDETVEVNRGRYTGNLPNLLGQLSGSSVDLSHTGQLGSPTRTSTPATVPSRPVFIEVPPQTQHPEFERADSPEATGEDWVTEDEETDMEQGVSRP